jgi:hypothetical protein
MDKRTIGLGWTGRPFGFESERNKEQMIADRMLGAVWACGMVRAHPHAPCRHPNGPGAPRAILLPQEVGHF